MRVGKYNVKYSLQDIEGWIEEIYTVSLKGKFLLDIISPKEKLTEEKINNFLTQSNNKNK